MKFIFLPELLQALYNFMWVGMMVPMNLMHFLNFPSLVLKLFTLL